MKSRLFDDPVFRRVFAVMAIIAALSFVDDVVMIASFWADGNYWSVAGRSLALVAIAGAAVLLWRAIREDVGELEEKVGGAAEEVREVKPCSAHEGMGIHPELVAWEHRGEDGEILYTGCMVCRFESVTNRLEWLERREAARTASDFDRKQEAP